MLRFGYSPSRGCLFESCPRPADLGIIGLPDTLSALAGWGDFARAPNPSPLRVAIGSRVADQSGTGMKNLLPLTIDRLKYFEFALDAVRRRAAKSSFSDADAPMGNGCYGATVELVVGKRWAGMAIADDVQQLRLREAGGNRCGLSRRGR